MSSLSATDFLVGLGHVACLLPVSHLLKLPTSKSSINHYRPFSSDHIWGPWVVSVKKTKLAMQVDILIQLHFYQKNAVVITGLTHTSLPRSTSLFQPSCSPQDSLPWVFFRAVGPMLFHLHPWLPDGSPYLLSGFCFNCFFLINPVPKGHT